MDGSVFVGRRTELRVLEERLAEARRGRPQVLFLEGEAGAGKSTLLSRFLGSVADAVVLEAGGDDGEALLSYGVVGQLDPAVGTDPGADPMVVGAQLVELIDRLQSDGKVVVLAIDDLQWADRASSRAILFALRRLRSDRALTVVSARAGELTDPGWGRFLNGNARVARLRLGGLSPADLIELAQSWGPDVLSHQQATRLAAHTGGNALYCRALLDEIGVAGLSGDHGGLPAPRQLSVLILARVSALPAAAQSFLAAASVLGQHAAASMIATVAGIGDPQRNADAVVGAGLMTEKVLARELTFAHPLYRTAIHADLSPTTRRELHGRAASLVGGQARLAHRVAAAPGPDDALARELDAAARVDAGGDLAASAWVLEQAANLSTEPLDRERRLLDAAVVHLNAADTSSAARVLASCHASSARRDALSGLLGVFTGSPSTETRLLAAWRAHDPTSEREIGARAATSLANWTVISGRPDQAVTWGERAVQRTESGSVLRAMAQTALAYALASAGRSSDGLGVLDFLPVSGSEVPVRQTDVLIMRGMVKVYNDDLSGAIADLGVAAARLRTGIPSTYPGPCLSHLSDAYFRRGEWDAAVTYAQLAISFAQDADRPLDLARAHARATQVLAYRGQWAEAQAHADAARSAALRFPHVLPLANAAMADVCIGSARSDSKRVLRATEALRASGFPDAGGRPGIFNWRGMEIDALVDVGRLGLAKELLDDFEAAIPPTGLVSATLTLARCQANLAVATGDMDRAKQLFVDAHATAEEVAMPFEDALVSLDAGRCSGVAGDPVAAIGQLERAHRLFSSLGADPYVQVCATELASLQVRVAAGSPATLLGLSRAEMAVARLVATGLTNREVAGELYVSVKTVEYHLRNSYQKLGITSRRSLNALLS